MLVTVTLGNPSLIVMAGNSNDTPKADPRLLQMAEENPDATFMVVIQKDAKNKDLKDDDPELAVEKGGGKVKKQLDLIVSFSAEVTGKEITKLAKNPKVRWISADAPVVSTSGDTIWVFCANENGTCTFSGTRQVRYGAGTSWNILTATNSIACNNSTFGDPIYGTAKTCEYSSNSPGLETVLDTFSARYYNSNDGTENWTGSWIEGNRYGDAQTSTPDTGILMVDSGGRCAGGSGYCLRIDPGEVGAYIYRKVNLKNVASAVLSLYRDNHLGENFRDAEVKLEVSGDGGATWSTLRSYSDREYTDSNVDTFDITAFASDKTRIRFYINNTQSYSHDIFFDNIQIEYAYPSPYRAIVGANNLPLDGQGVTVAVVDSGVADHPDLHSNPLNLNLAASSPSRILDSVVFGGYINPVDQYEHGTHVAGIIAGNGVASNGRYKGVAPGVNLLNIRVSNEQGLTYISDVVDGLQWIYNNKDLYNIRVVNLSITSTVAESYNTSALDAAVEILWFNGIVVVVAAGNNGTADGPSLLYPPANDPFAITVGAVEDRGTIALDDDFVGAFSAYGETESGFAKPELVAPGRNLISLLAGTDVTAYSGHPKHRVDNYYFRMSGTSMAAPVVSGTVALLLQDEPNLNPDQVKYRLMSTARKNWTGYDPAKAGAGTVDAFDAVFGTTTAGANQGILPSQMLATGDNAIAFDSVGWNSVGWNSVGWNSVGWNSVGWNTSTWDE